MIKMLCLICLISVIISVSANPLSQLVQPSNAYQPTSYSNPVAIQSSNTSPYSQGTTVKNPATFTGPLGDTLNQVILNRILSNPSLQKIIDPNTKLYNQKGEEVNRQTTAGVPNVINNYFIVPPEFFNVNETISQVDDGVKERRPRRRKLKRRLKQVQKIKNVKEGDVEDEEVRPKRRQQESENLKRKKTRIRSENVSVEDIDADESQEIISTRDEEIGKKRKRRVKMKKKEPIVTPLTAEESDEDDLDELEDLSPIIVNRKKEVKRPKKLKPKHIINDESNETVTEVLKSKSSKDKTVSSNIEEDAENTIDMAVMRSKKEQKGKISKEKILKNIEIPTDISNKAAPENRQTRDSKRNETKKEPSQRVRNTPKIEQPSITPFDDDVMKKFFPYMQMGNFYNPNTNYPYNFDQYYQHLNPPRNPDANRSQKKRKKQNRKNNDPNSNTHTIEIKLKPKKKENTTESVTTEKPDVQDITLSIETNQSTESIEQVTAIPMEMPQKVSPIDNEDTDSTSKESYETFSKLEDLHEFITPDLGTEDVVLPMSDNRIINDYYPVFDDDVYYSPYVEKVKSLEDNRYYYETGNEDRERRKFGRYEDARTLKRDHNNRDLENTENKSKSNRKIDVDIDEFDHKEYSDHLTTSDETNDVIKSDADIRRVKVPPKNTRVKVENVETLSAGSKVAKYGIQSQSDETIEDTSSYVGTDEKKSDGHPTYVVAKSLGRPEDYW